MEDIVELRPNYPEINWPFPNNPEIAPPLDAEANLVATELGYHNVASSPTTMNP